MRIQTADESVIPSYTEWENQIGKEQLFPKAPIQ
jgi:hypothetical protein